MNVLVLGPEEHKAIAALLKYAEENVLSPERVQRAALNPLDFPALGEYEKWTVLIPQGFKVVFNYEMQPNGKVRHMSVSVNGRLPHPEVVEALLVVFGFRNKLCNCFAWTEEDLAVNVIEFCDPGGPTPADGKINLVGGIY